MPSSSWKSSESTLTLRPSQADMPSTFSVRWRGETGEIFLYKEQRGLKPRGEENGGTCAVVFLHFLLEVIECSFNYNPMKQEDKHILTLSLLKYFWQTNETHGRIERFAAMSYCRHFTLGWLRSNRYVNVLPEQPSNNIPSLHAHISVLQNWMDKQQNLSTDTLLFIYFLNIRIKEQASFLFPLCLKMKDQTILKHIVI